MRNENGVTMNLKAAQQLDAQLEKTLNELRSSRRSVESAQAIARVASVRISMSKHLFDIVKFSAKQERDQKPRPALPAPRKSS